jgi:predicted DNA-binding transcriptional regulator YafY
MPLTKEALKRYMILDKLLSDQYHNYTLDDLTEEVSNRLSAGNSASNGVVRRTIEKDLDAIQLEPFYAEIEKYSVSKFNKEKQKERRRMCLRYANPSFSIFKKEMTDDEKYILSEAISLLGQFDGIPNFEALEAFRMGLGVKDPERKIISFTKNPLKDSTIFGELFTAISQKQVIELHYHKFNKPHEDLPVILYPYLLKEYSNRWYLFAVKTDGKERLYALDRITKCVPLPARDYVEYKGDINERFEDIVGVTLNEDKPVEHILFWVADETKEWVMTKPVHESQKHYKGKKEAELKKKYPSLQNGDFFSIDCRENYELITDLCYYGKDLLVLESTGTVKDEVFKRVQEMNDEYVKLLNL